MKRLLAAALLTVALPVAAVAHHGWSAYDASRETTLTGTIEDAGDEHPHGFTKLTTADQTWIVILAPPSRMERRGLTREMLKRGTKATVAGYPHRADAGEPRAERITSGDTSTELR